MPTSPGPNSRRPPGRRGHNGKGATIEAVADFASNNYPELVKRAERHKGADLALPLDLFAGARRRSK